VLGDLAPQSWHEFLHTKVRAEAGQPLAGLCAGEVATGGGVDGERLREWVRGHIGTRPQHRKGMEITLPG
jgi:hypothetical protein